MTTKHVVTDEQIEGQRKAAPSVHIINLDADPYCPQGLVTVSHQQGGQFVWDTEKVNLYLSEGQRRGSITGAELRKEVENQPVFNANLLDFLLAHPELIPEEWKGMVVFFWGTIYRGSFGDLCVRCLSWDGSRWCSGVGWLDDKWYAIDPAAVSAP